MSGWKHAGENRRRRRLAAISNSPRRTRKQPNERSTKMIEIKAFVHRSRAASVVRALRKGGFANMTAVDVKGMVKALDEKEQQYSTELGDRVITEVKLELVCEDDRLTEATELIRANGKTDMEESGFIYVSNITAAIPF